MRTRLAGVGWRGTATGSATGSSFATGGLATRAFLFITYITEVYCNGYVFNKVQILTDLSISLLLCVAYTAQGRPALDFRHLKKGLAYMAVDFGCVLRVYLDVKR